MNEENQIQKDLFENYNQPRRLRRKILGVNAPRRFYNITFSIEQIIFVVIGLLILFVVSFSLGVEKGKRQAIIKEQKLFQEEPVKEEVKKPELILEPLPVPAPKLSPSYVIQVASYKDNNEAEDEKRSLEKKGYTAEIAVSGKYSVIYITGFASKKEAQEVVTKIKGKHKDCFIKKRYN